MSVQLWLELDRPEGLNLSFPACEERAQSIATVKDDDEGVTAQAALLGDQQTAITLKMEQMTSSVQLIEALGGGWDASQLPSAASMIAKP